MDGTRKKLAVVVGEVAKPRFLNLYEPLAVHFDVTVFALNTPDLVDGHRTSLRLRLFEVITDMPGYLRGLEDELMGFDLILSQENSRLSSFQALRAARKYSIPFSVLTTEFHPYFYEKFANIRAIQFDINNKATKFLASSSGAEDSLTLDQVPQQSIARLTPTVSRDYMRFHPAGRRKFRDYVGIGQDETVLLYHGPLTSEARVEELLHAVKLLAMRQPEILKEIRLMIAGQGDHAQDLKYRAYDSGLGERVMFLQQNTDAFMVDLLSASDILVRPRPRQGDHHEAFALEVLEAAACGVYPVVTNGTPEAEALGGLVKGIDDDTFQSLAVALQKALENRPAVEGRAVFGDRFYSLQEARNSGQVLVQAMNEILSQAEEERHDEFAIDEIEEHAKNLIRTRREHDAVVTIEECLLVRDLTPVQNCGLLLLKGEALYSAGELERATETFSQCLKIDDKSYQAYRGLGYVSWQSHSNEEALTFFRKALAVQEDDPETMLGIALVYRRLSLTDEALFWLEKCLAVKNPPRSALLALTQTCLEMRESERAIEAIERAIESAGESSSLLVTLAQLHLREGRSEVGNEILQRALGA